MRKMIDLALIIWVIGFVYLSFSKVKQKTKRIVFVTTLLITIAAIFIGLLGVI